MCLICIHDISESEIVSILQYMIRFADFSAVESFILEKEVINRSKGLLYANICKEIRINNALS